MSRHYPVGQNLQSLPEKGSDPLLQSLPEKGSDPFFGALTSGGVHVSVEALGITDTLINSLRGLRKLGRHVQLGQPLEQHATPAIPLLETIYARQLSLMGSRGLPATRFPALFEMIAAGRLDPARLIGKRISLEEASGVFGLMDDYADVGVTMIDRF
jgi:alcohol dehydrogenase